MTDGHEYREGEPYPHDGREIPGERLEELASDRNQTGLPVISMVEVEEKPKKAK